MRITRMALLTGAAAILLAGYTGLAQANSLDSHVLTLRLPDGQIEQIRYTGDVPPSVSLAPDVAPASFDLGSPFAMLQQMTAAMDRQAALLFRDIGGLTLPDAAGPSLIPALSGPGVCMRSVQITYSGNGQAPHVVSQTSGDCGGVNSGSKPAALPDAPTPKRAPEVVQVMSASPYQGLVRQVSDWRR